MADLSVSYGRRLADLVVRGRLTGVGSAPKTVRFRAGASETETDGLYRTVLRAPDKPGVYTLQVSVAADRTRTRFALGERFDGPDERGAIPAFSRQYTGSIVVA